MLTGCYTFGNESSWLRVQNMGSGNADLSIQFVNDAGQIVGERSCPGPRCGSLAPGAAMTVGYQGASEFPAGVLGSTVVNSNQPVAALMVSDVGRGAGRFQSGGDTFSNSPAGGALYLPYIVLKAGPDSTWNSRFAIQNLNPAVPACVTLVYVGSGGSALSWEPYNPFQSAQHLSGCPNGGMRLGGGQSLFRDLSSMPVAEGFAGSVQAILHTNGQGASPTQQTVVGSAGIWNEQTMDFASYRAITNGELGTTVLLPLIERNASGYWSTYFQIQSPGPDANVTLRIVGKANNQPIAQQNTFTVHGSTLCIQDDPGRDCLGQTPGLPNGFQGYAVLTSSEKIGVVVHRANWAQELLSNYRGVRSGQATRKAYVPLVVKNATSNARTGEDSFLRIMVADGSTGNVTVRYKGATGSTVTQNLSVAGATTLSMNNLSVPLPSGFVGSAIVESNKPLVTVVGLTTGHAPGDNRVMFNAVPP